MNYPDYRPRRMRRTENLRRIAAPFLSAYITRFAGFVTLAGAAQRWSTLEFATLVNDQVAWIDMKLTVAERLHLPTAAGVLP